MGEREEELEGPEGEEGEGVACDGDPGGGEA